jgi:hypothetical protein
MQLNIFVSNFYVQVYASLKQQILEGFISFIGALICACSHLVVHFTVPSALVWSSVMVKFPLCICIYVT